MPLHDAFDQPQTQPSAYLFLGGKKRFEKLGSNCMWDARSRICHREPDARPSVVIPLSCPGNSQANLSASGDGVDAVAEEVGNQMANLIGYRINLRVIPDLFTDVDGFVPGSGGKDRNEPIQYWSDPDGRGLFGFAVEPQALRDVRSCAGRARFFCSA